MNKAVRRVGFVIAVIFAVLFANLNYVQLAKSRELTEHPRNRRSILGEYEVRRGEILAADNTVLARSEELRDNRYRYRRVYPEGELFGHITGFYSSKEFCGSMGLEATYNDYLLGKAPLSTETFVDEMFGNQPDGNIVKITIDPKLQRIARKAMGDQRGGVAAIDPRTGAVLAMYSNPTFDPNDVTRRGHEGCGDPKARLERRRSRPLRSRAFGEYYPPGSTFKIVTAAAGLADGMSPGTTFPDPSRLNLPDTDKSLGNFQQGSCAGGSISVTSAMRVSCNTTFAQMAMRVGAKKFTRMARRFGMDEHPGLDLTGVVTSCVVAQPAIGCGDGADLARPLLAYSGIGQQNVRVSPLQMARIAATVANRGLVPKPYLVQQILAPDGGIIQKTEPELSDRIYSRRVARQLRRLMIEVVQSGTGRVVGFDHASRGIIGGKTGTAQTGTGEPPHVWFAAWGPGIAVAAVVENGGDARREATGGRVAGPIAKALVDRVVARTLKEEDED